MNDQELTTGTRIGRPPRHESEAGESQGESPPRPPLDGERAGNQNECGEYIDGVPADPLQWEEWIDDEKEDDEKEKQEGKALVRFAEEHIDEPMPDGHRGMLHQRFR